jgi:hypothetical protein
MQRYINHCLSYLRWFIVFLLLPAPVFAYIHTFPSSLSQEVLSESVPTAFAPERLEAADFAVEWIGKPIEGVRFSLGRSSLEWVRVADVLALPRARLMLEVDDVQAAQVWSGGFVQALFLENAKGTGEIPVALISGDKNPIQIVIHRDGKQEQGQLQISFRPRRTDSGARIYTDPSCSPFQLKPVSILPENWKNQWMYVGCRLVYVEGSEHRTSSLEVFVYWDNVGQVIDIDGVSTSAPSPSVWPMRLRSKPGRVSLKAGSNEVVFRYGIADYLHLGFLGLGIGPYTYIFESAGAGSNTIAPLVTLYGSYFITESIRLVAFDATSINNNFFTDFGIYLNNESVKTLDNRISMYVMLGAHALGFKANGKREFIFGGPQGVEILFRDAFIKGHNFSMGSFLYPPIDGKAYYNVWFRWGSAKLFGEFNYIGWQEKVDNQRIYSRSVGITIGFPIARFL